MWSGCMVPRHPLFTLQQHYAQFCENKIACQPSGRGKFKELKVAKDPCTRYLRGKQRYEVPALSNNRSHFKHTCEIASATKVRNLQSITRSGLVTWKKQQSYLLMEPNLICLHGQHSCTLTAILSLMKGGLRASHIPNMGHCSRSLFSQISDGKLLLIFDVFKMYLIVDIFAYSNSKPNKNI